MNMHNPELLRQHAEFLARRNRMAKPARAPAKPEPEPLPAPKVINLAKLRQHDAHVITWRFWLANEATKCKTYLKRRCVGEGISLDELMVDCRKKEIVRLRDTLVYELKTFVKPGISFPELGRLFDKDHTTMILSYWRGAMLHGDTAAEEAVMARRRKEAERARRYRMSGAGRP